MIKTKHISKCIAIILSLLLLTATIPLSLAAADYSEQGATYFDFSDSAITATDGDYTGYTIDGTDLSIKSAGTYIVSGSCADGSIVVKKGTTGVILVLSDLTLQSSDTAPITCNKSSGVTIVAADGTTSTLTDAEYNNDDNFPDNELAESAVIKCKDGSQVTICGSGTINVVSKGKNGIKSGSTTEEEGEAWLTIRDVTLNISTTVGDGINAEAELMILGGNINVSAADDGIHSDYTLIIGAAETAGPSIKITQSTEGIEGAELTIYSGDVEIHSTDDGMNAANSDLTDYAFSLNIAGGDVYINAESGDGIDSNGTLTISGGTVEIFSASSGDNQPLDSDGTMSITGGTVLAVGSYGMGLRLSASQPYVSFGSQSGGMGGGLFGVQSGSGVSVSANSAIAITDSNGEVLYNSTAVRNASYVFFSSEELSDGSTYTLTLNGKSAATAQCGTSSSGGSIIPTDPDGESFFSLIIERIKSIFSRIFELFSSFFNFG